MNKYITPLTENEVLTGRQAHPWSSLCWGRRGEGGEGGPELRFGEPYLGNLSTYFWAKVTALEGKPPDRSAGRLGKQSRKPWGEPTWERMPNSGCQNPVRPHSSRPGQPRPAWSSALTLVSYQRRELVISSLMTIYLLFCKSKAKYHMLCSHLLGGPQARGKLSQPEEAP